MAHYSLGFFCGTSASVILQWQLICPGKGMRSLGLGQEGQVQTSDSQGMAIINLPGPLLLVPRSKGTEPIIYVSIWDQRNGLSQSRLRGMSVQFTPL